MVVILLGPPGVGKGTQGVLLEEALQWERVATGDLLRNAVREGTELGRKAHGYMEAGDLVPDALIVSLVKELLAGLPPAKGVLLDGFPRTLAQGEALDQVLPEVNRQVDGVVLLEAPDEVLVKRVSGRRSCPDCGRVYNVHFDPPVTEGICDGCGSRLAHRKDDAPDTVAHRLEVYRELTEPLVAYYQGGDVPLLRVDGDRALDEVTGAIRSALAEELGVEAP
jgi:adenylate kinase